jgi:hypothetical protein
VKPGARGTPIPAWSVTRARAFETCLRRYFYQYHLAPEGRKPGAAPEAVQANRLSGLLGLEAWTGQIVHDALRHSLGQWRLGRPFSEPEAIQLSSRWLSQQFRTSAEYWEAHQDEFARRPPLLELHVYGSGNLPRPRATALKERVFESLRGFFRSDLATAIRRADPSRWLPIDRNAEVRLFSDLRVLVRPDFAFRHDGLLRILDWKTGQGDPGWERIQLACYALYAAEKWGQELAWIDPRLVQLYPSFSMPSLHLTGSDIQHVADYIRESQERIQTLLAADGPSSLPAVDRFPMTDDLQSCRWCSFRRLCGRESAGSTGDPDGYSQGPTREG